MDVDDEDYDLLLLIVILNGLNKLATFNFLANNLRNIYLERH